MPVTARLLQRLHESLGDEATNDLFAWWDEAATVNRVAVREVADLYFARFDARLEKGLVEVRGELRTELAKESGQLRSEFAKELGQVRSEMAEGFGRVTEDFGKVRTEFAQVRTEMADLRADLIKWMFLFWIGTIVPLAGLIVALTKR